MVDAPSRETELVAPRNVDRILSVRISLFPSSPSFLSLSLCLSTGRTMALVSLQRWKIGDFTIGSIIDKRPTTWILDERIGFLALLIFILFPSPFFFFSDLLVVDVSLSIVENNRTCSWHRSWPTGCWYSFAMKFSFARWNNLRGNCFYEIDISMSFLLPILFFFSFREIIFAQLFFLKFKSLEGLIGDLRITYSRFLSSFTRYGGEKWKIDLAIFLGLEEI